MSWCLFICISIESVMPFNHLILCPPFLLLPEVFPSIRLFSKWVCFSQCVAKVLEFQLQHQSFQWMFRTDFLQDWLVGSPCSQSDSQESSPAPQLKSINSSVLSIFYGPISHMYMTTGKTLALTMQTFVGFHILTYEDSSRNFWLNIRNFLHDQMNHLPIKRISFHFPYKFVCVCVCVYMHIYLLLMLLHQLELTAWYKKWLKEFLFNFLKAFFFYH